jgi:NAD(P)-dependent dehydrogenase (short-subunit alcohol dehydrogenase family)
MSIHNQRIAILGGSSGIGLALAKLTASLGAQVIITGRDEKKLQEAVKQINAPVQAEVADGANAQQMKDFFSKIGRVDHLVITLSGAKGGGMLKDLDLSELRAGFEAKFWAHITSLQVALPFLLADGSVTLISSISARRASPGTAGLAAINGAIEAMIPTLAVELRPLRVNAVSPGVIDTPWWNRIPEEQRRALFDQSAAQTPVGRVGKPEDIARAVLFIIEDTFITGSVIECDGGLRLM